MATTPARIDRDVRRACRRAFDAIAETGSGVRRASEMGAVFETDLPDRKRGGLAVSHDQDAIFILGDAPALARVFRALAGHPAATTAARQALGSGHVVLHFMTLTSKAPYVGSGIAWHRDADNRYMRSRDGHFVRIMVCLDAMGPANGGTRFQLGSHRLARPTDGLTTVAPTCPAGTILVVHPKVRHGGPPNHSPSPRRLAVIQYGRRDDPIIAEERESITGIAPRWPGLNDLRHGL